MNQCPSCGAERDEELNVCHECGHVFSDEPKHTIMGFPGLKAALDAEPKEEVDANKQTLFGFPAQKFGQSSPPPETTEPESGEFDDDETNIIDPRGTIAGFNVQDHGFPGGHESEGLDEESDGAPTMIGSPMIGSEVKTFEEPRETNSENKSRGFGTVMGMSVADIMSGEHESEDDGETIPVGPASNPKSTQFAMPAFNPDEDNDEDIPAAPDGSGKGEMPNSQTTQFSMPAFSAESEGEISEPEADDAHTVTWNPDMVAASSDDSVEKKEVLAKLRENKPTLTRQTDAKGLPSIKGSKPLPKPGELGSKLGLSVPKPKGLVPSRQQIETPLEFPEDETQAQTKEEKPATGTDTATTGVLKRAGERRQTADPVAGQSPIAGAYVVPKEDLTADDLGDDDDAPTEMIQAPSFLDQQSQSLPIEDTEAEDEEDLAYAETGIVPGNIADRVLADVREEVQAPSLDPWAQSNDDLSIQDQVGDTQERNTPQPQPYQTQPSLGDAAAPASTDVASQVTAPTSLPQQFQQPAQVQTPAQTPAPYQPLPQQAPNQPLQQQTPNRVVQPTQHAVPNQSDDEKLVGLIQAGFGLLGSFVAMVVVAMGILQGGLGVGWLPVGVSALMALVLGGSAFLPIKLKTKSMLYGLAAFVLFGMGIIGLFISVAFWFGWIFAAAFAVCGAAFPLIAKKIL